MKVGHVRHIFVSKWKMSLHLCNCQNTIYFAKTLFSANLNIFNSWMEEITILIIVFTKRFTPLVSPQQLSTPASPSAPQWQPRAAPPTSWSSVSPACWERICLKYSDFYSVRHFHILELELDSIGLKMNKRSHQNSKLLIIYKVSPFFFLILTLLILKI